MKNKYLYVKEIFAGLVVALTMTVMFTTVNAQSSDEKSKSERLEVSSNQKLEGTWLTNVTFPDGFSLKVLFTFMPGRDEDEGTLIDQNEFQLTPNPVCTADQGVWKRTAIRRFVATHLAFCFDATQNFDPAGSVKVRDEINLNRTGSAFSGRQYIEIFDVDGNLVVTFEAAMTATRVNAEAPPPSTQSSESLKQMYQKYERFKKKN